MTSLYKVTSSEDGILFRIDWIIIVTKIITFKHQNKKCIDPKSNVTAFLAHPVALLLPLLSLLNVDCITILEKLKCWLLKFVIKQVIYS